MHLKRTLLSAGFTLIELMVVVSIIGVLMASGILAFSNAQQNARDARRRADIDAISKALEQYNVNTGVGLYPATASSITSYFPAGSVPLDPRGTSYDLKLTTSTYCVCATLEKTGRGNASAVGNVSGVCTYATTGDYFCASQRQ
jgi:general secretion pathway protein G